MYNRARVSLSKSTSYFCTNCIFLAVGRSICMCMHKTGRGDQGGREGEGVVEGEKRKGGRARREKKRKGG